MKRNDKGQFVKVEKKKVICPQCGKEFEIYPSDYKRGRRFCSIECASEWKSNKYQGENHHRYERETSICENCGKEFEHLPSDERRFCSHKCANEHLAQERKYLTGSDSPNWKGGKTPEIKRIRASRDYAIWREAVFERDKYTCQDCGAKDKFLNVHHIISMSEDISKALDIDNGITLCVNCHQKRHPNLSLNIEQSEKNARS